MPLSQDLQKFIDALGLGSEESLFFRLLKPKDFDQSNQVHLDLLTGVTYLDKKFGNRIARKENIRYDQLTGDVFWQTNTKDIKKSNNLEAYLKDQSDLGMAVYIVVNPGGQYDTDIVQANVIYYENDTKSIDEQLEEFDTLSESWKGSFAVQTSKSVHAYFRLDTALEAQKIKYNQQRLIKKMSSDPAVCNPSRVMRVPGYDHIQMVNNEVVRTPITLVREWDGTFASWEKISSELPCIDIVPTKSKLSLTMNPAPTDNSKNPNLPNLSSFLSKDNRDYIINGVEIGRRNTTAKAVAMDLIGTVRQLEEMGIPYSGTAEELYDQYSAHCDTASPGELAGIWEATLKHSPSACLDQDKMVTNNSAFYARTFQGPIVGFGNGQTPKPQHNQSVYKSLLAEDLETLDEEDFTQKFLDKTDKRCWQEVKESLPKEIVANIEYFSRRTGINQEVYALAYLTQAASIVTGKYDVAVSGEWHEPINLFYVIIGEPGVKKSSVINTFGKFHDILNERYKIEYQAALKVYNQELAEWTTQKKECGDFDADEPIKPTQRKSSVGKSTQPKFVQTLENQRSHNNSGTSYMADEITALFGSMDANGGSTEKSMLLIGHSGFAITSDTKIDGDQGVSDARFCVSGTTQPKTWEKFIAKHADEEGLEERFLVALINTTDIKPYNHLDKSSAPYQTTDLMLEMATRFDSITGNHLVKIPDCIRLHLNQIEYWASLDISGRAKPKAHVLRIAGLLAVLRDPSHPEMSLSDLNSAFALMDYTEQSKKELTGSKNASIADNVMNKVLKFLERKGTITISNIGAGINDLRNVSTEDRVAILNKVVDIMGSKVNLEFNKKGMPVVSLIGANVPDLKAIPDLKASNSVVPATFQKEVLVAQSSISEVDSIDTFEVESEGIPNMATKEVSLEETLTVRYEAEIVQADQVQTDQVQMIYVPNHLIPPELINHVSDDDFYAVVKSTPKGLKIRMEGVKNPVNIPLNKTE